MYVEIAVDITVLHYTRCYDTTLLVKRGGVLITYWMWTATIEC